MPGSAAGTAARAVAWIGAVLVAAAAIAGCGAGPGHVRAARRPAGPSTLVVWRLGTGTAAQNRWMNGVVAQWKQNFPQYSRTAVSVRWVPAASAAADWASALRAGKGGPDITETGNTQTAALAAKGALADISGGVQAWPSGSPLIPGALANDTVNGRIYAVPWYASVPGVWYNTAEFAAAKITSLPVTWTELVDDARKLMHKYPHTYGIGAPADDTDAILSFIWGAGGQVAQQQNGKWTAQLTSPAAEAGLRQYASLYLIDAVTPPAYTGMPGTTAPAGGGKAGKASAAPSGNPEADFAAGKLGMYIDGPWARAQLQQLNPAAAPQWASFPIPSQNGPHPAPAVASGDDLAVWAASKQKAADWSLIKVMDSAANATTLASAQDSFPAFTAQLSAGAFASPVSSGFARAAAYTQMSPLNSPNWASAADILPALMQALESGASFAPTVRRANGQLQAALNTGREQLG